MLSGSDFQANRIGPPDVKIGDVAHRTVEAPSLAFRARQVKADQVKYFVSEYERSNV